MRLFFALVLVCGCSFSGLAPVATDGAPADLAVADGAGSTPDIAGFDASGLTCTSSCARCLAACCPGAGGATPGCCAVGEWCDRGTCHCGAGSVCGAGERCSWGPGAGPANGCGGFCCGGASGVSCPR